MNSPKSSTLIKQVEDWLDGLQRMRISDEATNAPPSNETSVDAATAAGSSTNGQSIGKSSLHLQDDIDVSAGDGFRRHNMYQTMTGEEDCVIRGKMMVDQLMCKLQEMVDSCEDRSDFQSVLEWILKQEPLYLTTTLFNKQGTYCLGKIIKMIKPTDPLAYCLTECVAVWFHDLMIHPVYKSTVHKCLIHFADLPNRVLHQQILFGFQHLATHEIGCKSLNECIDVISGEQKEILMKHIAVNSVPLAFDPYGNYVLQHVLEHGFKDVNANIVLRLKGHFVELSHLKDGSHVVEKCLECCSDFGIAAVVDEILGRSETPYLLARHPFGNYVIQKALRKTAETPRCMHLHDALVKVLEPNSKKLERSGAAGLHVANLIKELK